jgi:hypothetical protein
MPTNNNDRRGTFANRDIDREFEISRILCRRMPLDRRAISLEADQQIGVD